MRVVVDASLIVAAHVERESLHAPAFAWLNQHLGSDDLFLAAHTLAEIYAGLTKQKVPTDRAESMIVDIVRLLGRDHIIELGADDYLLAVKKVAGKRYTSGIIYDAMVTRVAEKVSAPWIATLNRRHFELLWAPDDLIVPEP